MNARFCIVAPFSYTSSVEPWGFPMECEFEYDKGEPPIWNPIDRAHPGAPPNAILMSCRVGGVEITDMLRECQRERIEELLIEQMENS